ncbi:MAG: type II toxin-antitoxin system RelE/ParE family toxin [Verrucomicrobia bacterium]|nr:type II toxin-antitoxin system RelE/ParE family toxin [Verrucomicrobiota bacterium]
MSHSLKVTRLASEDYENILDYTIERWGLGQYRKYRSMLRDAIDSITENPQHLISKTREDLFDGARLYPIGRHYLVYYTSGEIVILARILHQQMDLVSNLDEI